MQETFVLIRNAKGRKRFCKVGPSMNKKIVMGTSRERRRREKE